MAIQRTLSKREKITLLIFGVVLFLFLAVFAWFLYTGRINVKAQIPVSKKSVSFNQQASLPTYDNRFGVVSSVLTSHDPATINEEMTAMQQAGIKWVRCSFTWHTLESTKGQWDFSGADMVVQSANEHGIQILGILGGTPRWANGDIGGYYGPAYPPTAEHMVDWQNYITTLCTRYPTITAWEIWNEENIAFWQPHPDPNGYTDLMKVTYPVIKAVNPNTKVIMGGLAGGGPGAYDYLESCLKLGIADYIDAIAYHPYPETLQTPGYFMPTNIPQEATCRIVLQNMQVLVANYTTKKLETWLTETGWTTTTLWPLFLGVSPGTQADYLFRTWVTYADTNVDKVFYYDLWRMANDGMPLNNYGLLKYDFTPEPAYNYYKTFESVFGKAVASNPNALSYNPSSTTTELHSFNQADGSLVAAIWKADDQNDTVTLKTNNNSYYSPIAINPLTGQEQVVTGVSRDGQGITTISNLAIGKTPVVLKFQPKTTTPNAIYSWQFKGQGADKDLSKLSPGEQATIILTAKNTGNTTWYRSSSNPVRVGTTHSRDRSSTFANGTWLGPNRPVGLSVGTDSVAPGATTTFTWTYTAPSRPGTYYEHFSLLAEGITWMNNPGVCYYTVVKGNYSWQFISQTASTNLANLAKGQVATITLTAKNTGNTTWFRTGRCPVRVGTTHSRDRMSAFANGTWLGTNRPVGLPVGTDSVAPGATVTFTWTYTAPARAGTYWEHFSLLAEGITWMNDPGVNYYTVVH